MCTMDFDIRKVDALKLDGNLVENWKIFKQNFDEYANEIELSEKPESVKIAVFLYAIGQEALETYHTFKLSTEDAAKYELVINVFSNFCQPKTNEVYEAFKFYNRKQQENEPFDDFLMDLKRLVLTCQFAEPDRMIRDNIVRGVHDKILQKHLLEAEKLDLKMAIGMARVAEAERQWSKIDSESELPITQSSILTLNEYCLLDIFDALQLEDAFNLAECCNHLKYIADRSFKKNSVFELSSSILDKGDEYIERIFYYIGHHVLSLCINCKKHRNLNLIQILYKIFKYCKKLKSLKIEFWEGTEFQDIPSYTFDRGFDNVEMLTVYYSTFAFTQSFLEKFHKLKFFNFIYSDCLYDLNDPYYFEFDQLDGLKRILQNNPDIESFSCSYYARDESFDFNCKNLQLIPKVERLFLEISATGLNLISQLNHLTRLHINCNGMNITSLLCELAETGNLEEMELERFELDEDIMDILISFEKLQLLIITNVSFELDSPIIWPTKLKLLHLDDCSITHSFFMSTIKQLKNLQSIKFQFTESIFDDATKLSQQILNVIMFRERRIDVILNGTYFMDWKYYSEKYIFVSRQLRILNDKYEHLDLMKGIHFPDYSDFC